MFDISVIVVNLVPDMRNGIRNDRVEDDNEACDGNAGVHPMFGVLSERGNETRIPTPHFIV